MPAIIYLGVDPSLTQPGIALLDENGVPRLVTSIKTPTKSRGVTRLKFIADAIKFMGEPVSSWAIEGPSLGSTHREFDLGEASGVIKLTVLSFFSPMEPTIVEPTRLKKFFTGNGSASKEAMINRAWELGVTVEDDDNAADAYALARFAWAMKNKDKLKTRHEIEVINAVLAPKKTAKRIPVSKNL